MADALGDVLDLFLEGLVVFDFVPVDLYRLLELLYGRLLSALVLRGQVIVHCPFNNHIRPAKHIYSIRDGRYIEANSHQGQLSPAPAPP